MHKETKGAVAAVPKTVEHFRQRCEHTAFKAMAQRGLGQGASGWVFEACLDIRNEPCMFAIKVMPLGEAAGQTPVGDATDELAMAIRMGEAGVGPSVVDAWTCNHVRSHYADLFASEPRATFLRGYQDFTGVPLDKGVTYLFMVMDKARGKTLAWWLAYIRGNVPATICNAIRASIHTMHDLGIFHNDLRADNIILNLTASGFVATIVYFGSAMDLGRPLTPDEREQDVAHLQATTGCDVI